MHVSEANLKPGDQVLWLPPTSSGRPREKGTVQESSGRLVLQLATATAMVLHPDHEVLMISRKNPEDERADRERARLKADGDAYVAWVYARALCTSGSETRAEVAAKDARYHVEERGPGFVEWQRFIQVNMSLDGMMDRLVGAPR